jgi:hypothetical protein
LLTSIGFSVEDLIKFLNKNGQSQSELGIIGPEKENGDASIEKLAKDEEELASKEPVSWEELDRRTLMIDGTTYENGLTSRFGFESSWTVEWRDKIREKGKHT